MDREAWRAAVHGVTKSLTRLSNWTDWLNCRKVQTSYNTHIFVRLFCCLVPELCLTRCDPMDCNPPAPLSMRFPKQEDWSRLLFPSPRDLPDPGLKPVSPALAGELSAAEPPEKSFCLDSIMQKWNIICVWLKLKTFKAFYGNESHH